MEPVHAASVIPPPPSTALDCSDIPPPPSHALANRSAIPPPPSTALSCTKIPPPPKTGRQPSHPQASS